MPYAALSDVLTRYRPITTMVGTADYDVTSTEVASVFIRDAESLVDAYLAGKYIVPLTSNNPLITMVSCDLATHAMLAEKMPSVPEFMQKRHDRAIDILEKLAKGELRLNSETLVGSTGDSFAWSSTQGTHPIFSPVLGPLDQAVDATRIDEALGERVDDTTITE